MLSALFLALCRVILCSSFLLLLDPRSCLLSRVLKPQLPLARVYLQCNTSSFSYTALDLSFPLFLAPESEVWLCFNNSCCYTLPSYVLVSFTCLVSRPQSHSSISSLGLKCRWGEPHFTTLSQCLAVIPTRGQ